MPDGDVDRDCVLAVLRASGVSVSACTSDPCADSFTIAKGTRIEVQKLPQRVSRKMLHYLQYHFDIPIEHFYHPDMLAGRQQVSQPGKPKSVN